MNYVINDDSMNLLVWHKIGKTEDQTVLNFSISSYISNKCQHTRETCITGKICFKESQKQDYVFEGANLKEGTFIWSIKVILFLKKSSKAYLI